MLFKLIDSQGSRFIFVYQIIFHPDYLFRDLTGHLTPYCPLYGVHLARGMPK
jgi:hypothetical protein